MHPDCEVIELTIFIICKTCLRSLLFFLLRLQNFRTIETMCSVRNLSLMKLVHMQAFEDFTTIVDFCSYE